MSNEPNFSAGILADDLTSAADGAGPFVARGLRAIAGRGCLPQQDFPVAAVDSGSRSAAAGQAGERTARLTAQLAPRRILYKTVDSTLRGHVTVELEAAFKACGRSRLVLAPAFPEAGRITRDGIQFVDGVPVSESVYGRDPVHPARTSDLASLVPADIRDKVVVLDASSQEELDARVAALPDPQDILWVGSPGMAMALARRLMPAPVPAELQLPPVQSVLAVIGSANPCSHRQADQVVGLTGVQVLRSPSVRQDRPADILRSLTSQAAELLREGAVELLIATGGDTMEAVLDLLNIRTFEILGELEPGFPLGRAADGDGRGLLLAMKAGGFGDDQTLVRVITQLRHAGPSSERTLP